IEPLDQLDEGRFSGSRMADKADPLAAADQDGEPLIERRVVPTISECDVVEANLARPDTDRDGVRPVLDPERLVVKIDQFFHLVHRALQVMDVKADVDEIAVDDEIAGEHEGDVAGRRGPAPP